MGQVSAFPRPTQVTYLPTRSERGLMSREWFSMNCGVMVLICVPEECVHRRAMQCSPLTLTLAMFSILYPQLKGSGFKKGVCIWCFMPWVSHPGAPLAWLPFLEGLSLPSQVPSPLSSLMANQPLFLPAMGSHGWSGLDCHSDSNASSPVECLSLLWQGLQWTLWLCLWCHQGPCLWHLPPCWHSSSRCATHVERVMTGWLPLNFHRGKKLVTHGLLVLAVGGFLEASITSFSASHATQR